MKTKSFLFPRFLPEVELIYMGWFILERKDASQIVTKEKVFSFYTRVLVRDFEWGVLVKQGVTTLLPSGRVTPFFKLPWDDIEVYLGSAGDFSVPFNISPYISSIKINVGGTLYARISNPVILVRNVDNPSTQVIHERVRNAMEMSFVSVISKLQIPEIQGAILQQPTTIAANILSEMGVVARYVTLSRVSIPAVIETALHSSAASYPERDRIRNLALALGKNSPMVNQQILQWENRGTVSDLLNLLLLANISGQTTALMTPPAPQPQLQKQFQPLQVMQAAAPMIQVPADNKACSICGGIMDGRTGVLQCPICKTTFHELCARKYVVNKGGCPICKKAVRVT